MHYKYVHIPKPCSQSSNNEYMNLQKGSNKKEQDDVLQSKQIFISATCKNGWNGTLDEQNIISTTDKYK